jgi:hypothetical protein
MKILETLPSTMTLKDRTKTWTVPSLIDALREGGPLSTDKHAYVLHSLRDGRQAIVMVESNGGLAKTASYLEVR